jgi:hypothetical protein
VRVVVYRHAGDHSADHRSVAVSRLLVRLVIVDRNRPEMYERLSDLFARAPHVQVIFDRRSGVGESPTTERRQEAEPEFRSRGYIVVDVP